MNDIYLTGTFRNDWNLDFNIKLVKILEGQGFSVYMPQRDTEQKENRQNTYTQNIAGIDESKIVLAIGTKTQTANWGMEIGYALKAGKPIVILTDQEHPVELMPEGAATKIITVKKMDNMEDYKGELIATVKLSLQSA